MSKKNDYKGCTKFENWLKKSGGDYPTMDTDIIHPIDYSLGVGARHKEGGVTARDDKDDKTVILSITSWIGISSGARHIYGKLRVPGTTLLQDGHKGSRSGYGTPDYISGWSIDITKELNQHALDLDAKGHPADKCFEDMELGEETTRFERDEEDMLIKRASYIFCKWFTGPWEIKIQNN